MHRIDEKLLITPALLLRFEQEAVLEEGDGRHYAVIQRSNGDFIAHDRGPPLSPEQVMFARDVLDLLNRELHHDGAWVVVFTHPKPASAADATAEYARFAMMWMDRDGDIQFTVDWVEGEGDIFDFPDVLMAGRETWANHAEEAWTTWRGLMVDVLDPSEGQTFKRAQGQAPASVH